MKSEPPIPALAARAAVRALTASKIRELVNAGQGRSDLLAFWVGEPDQPTPDFIRKAGIDSIAAGEVFYTHNLGIPSLRQAVAGYISGLHRETSADEVAIVSSGVSALMLVSQLLVDPGDRVVEVVPLWPNLQEIPKILGAEVKTVALNFSKSGWTLDLDKLIHELKPGTRALYLNSPNNPTGWTVTRDEQRALQGGEGFSCRGAETDPQSEGRIAGRDDVRVLRRGGNDRQPRLLQAPGARAGARARSRGRVRPRRRRVRALVLRRRRGTPRRGDPPLPAVYYYLAFNCSSNAHPARHRHADVLLVEHLDLAGELRAFLDLALGVADLARHLAGGVDHELLAHRELAFEAAVDLRLVDRDGALEHPMRGDLEHARVERRLDAAFHHQRVAIADLDALDLDLGADDELGFLALVGSRFRARGVVGGQRCCIRRRGFRRHRLILVEHAVIAFAEETVFL